MSHNIATEIQNLPERVTSRDCPGRADVVYSQPDPLATLMLLQMIADAYEDRRVTLELHGDRMRKEGIKTTLNSSQRKIENFLMYGRFLSRPGPEERKSTPPHDDVPPPYPHWERCMQRLDHTPPRKSRGSRIKNLACRVLQRFRVRRRVKTPPCPPLVIKKLDPPPPRAPLPARSALPRIVPDCKPRLRRMTSADTRALIACSVRKKHNARKSSLNSDTKPMQPIVAIPPRPPSLASHSQHGFSLAPNSDGLPSVHSSEHEEGWDIPIPFHLIFFIIIPMIFVLVVFMVLAVFIGLGRGFVRWVLFGEPVAEHRYEEYDDEAGCKYFDGEEGWYASWQEGP